MSFVKSATSTTHLRDASEGIEKAESPPAHLQPRTIVDVDPDGDLFLDVALDTKGVAYRYRVCSGTLRRHSPVWKTMLFGPWLESKPTNSEEWVVQLPEDPAYPMLIILNIVHGRFADVPQDIRLGNLRDILALTNKYDMTSIVRPLCAQWIAVARRSKNSTEKNSTGDFSFKRSAKNTLRSLYVAWELGDEVLFALRLEELSLRTRMDTEGRLSYATSRRSRKGTTLNDENYLGPQDALDTICAIREALLEMLITPIHEDLDARMKADPYYKIGSSGYRRMLCDAATIGSIHRHMLQTKGSILTKPASEIEDSVIELASWLFSMMSKIPTVHGDERTSDSIHARNWECFPVPKYKKLCIGIQIDTPKVVAGFIKPSHREYMAAQRAKTGLVMQDDRSARRYWHWPWS